MIDAIFVCRFVHDVPDAMAKHLVDGAHFLGGAQEAQDGAAVLEPADEAVHEQVEPAQLGGFYAAGVEDRPELVRCRGCGGHLWGYFVRTTCSGRCATE